MYVSFLAFSEVLRDLRGCGSIALPVSNIPEFIEYCNARGVYPCGGGFALLETGSMVQYLYM